MSTMETQVTGTGELLLVPVASFNFLVLWKAEYKSALLVGVET